MKFYHITDTHYFSKKYFEDINCPQLVDQLQRKITRELLISTLDYIKKDTETPYVFIGGDVTYNGETESHKELLEILRDFAATSGKKVYLITAGHDYDPEVDRTWVPKGVECPPEFIGKKVTCHIDKNGAKVFDVPTVLRGYLRDNYTEFGYNDAAGRHEPSMSYYVDLPENVRVFMLNDDSNADVQTKVRMPRAGFSPSLIEFVRAASDEAKSKGMHVFAISHYPLKAPTPIFGVITQKDISDNSMHQIDALCEMGIPVVFTGHTHMHKNTFLSSENGNTTYNVGTAALVGCPPFFRHVDYDVEAETMDIATITVPAPKDLDLGGKTLMEYTENVFFGYIETFLDCMGKDVDKFAEMSSSISLKPDKIRKIGWLIKPVGKFLNKLTFGKVARFTRAETGYKKADYSGVKDKRVLPFIVQLIKKMYIGDADTDTQSKEYRIAMGLIAIVDSLATVLHLNLKKLIKANSFADVVEPMLINTGLPDSNLKINLYKAPVLPIMPPRPVSKKGGFIVAAAVVSIIILSPVLIPTALVCGAVTGVNKLIKKLRAAPKN